jgi:hypothetical protein
MKWQDYQPNKFAAQWQVYGMPDFIKTRSRESPSDVRKNPLFQNEANCETDTNIDETDSSRVCVDFL